MGRKKILMDLLAQAREQEKNFVADLSEEERARKGEPDAWSPKDVIAHIAAWKARWVDNLGALAEGKSPTVIEDFDHVNASLFEAHREDTWEEVLDLAQDSYQKLHAGVEALDEESLANQDIQTGQGPRPLWRPILGNGYTHPMVHLAEHYREKGDRDRAGELVGEMARSMVDLDDNPAWRGAVRYNMACHYALFGDKERAIQELKEALELNPGLIEWSKQDSDLDSIREERGYQAIYAD
jgi:tetratricopeptide (TPR) repeat protein